MARPVFPPAFLAFAALLSGCPDQNISAVNAKPEATITSHEDGDVVSEGDVVTFWGVVSDPDHQTSSLLATWYLGGEKVCTAAPPTTDGMTSCEAQVGLDDTSVSLEVIDPKGAAGAAVVTLVIEPTDAPSASIVSPLAAGVYYADQLITFEGLVSDTEDVPDALTAWWESSLDGQLAIPSQPDSSGEVLGTGYLTEGAHAITLHAQDSTGKTGTDSVIISVGPTNSAPSCAITAPGSGSAGAEGVVVTFEALVSDPDVPADWLQVTWSSDKDGELGQSTPDSDGSVGFPYAALSVNTHVISLQVEDEVGATCTDSIYYTVGTPPEVTLTSPSSGSVYDEGLAVPFSAQVSDDEDRASDLALSWVSDLDGEFSTQRADSAGLAEFSYAGLSAGAHTVTLLLTVQNSAPTAPTVALSPSDPVEGEDDLVCAVVGASTDADGDALSYTVAWTVDGTAWTGSTATTTLAGDTISAADLVAGELWACVVTPSDGSAAGPSGSAAVAIVSGAEELWQGVTLRLADADYGFLGEAASDFAGRVVASAGDVDGDGLDDILVGAPSNDAGGTDAGKAYLVLGSSLGSTGTLRLSSADYVFVGEVAGDNAGHSVASAGDVDGDGLDDLLLGAPYNDDGGSYAGKVYLVLGSSLGSTTTVDLSAADYAFVGENTDDYAGFSVASAGDVDGDGLGDLLIGAPFNDDGGSYAGKVYLVLGASLGSGTTLDLSGADYVFIGENSSDYAGMSVAPAGDVDGDGLGDLLLGAPYADGGTTDAGKAYLILGDRLLTTTTIPLSTADGIFVGEAESDMAGVSVASAGDVDRDGLDDLLFGAYASDDGGTGTGKAYVVLATSLPPSGTTSYLADADLTFVGTSDSDYAGFSVAPARDVDGDGHADFLVSAFLNDDAALSAGKVYLFLNVWLPPSGTVELAEWHAFAGEAASDYAGYSVASAGDVDGDGLADILIGALYNDEGGNQAGKAYLVTWPTIVAHAPEPDLHDAPYRFTGQDTSERAGWAVSGAGDVDGDGLDDVLVGAPGAGSDAGKAFVVLGASLTLGTLSLGSADFALTGEAASDFAGYSLSGVGDTDGDGLDDLLVGAYGNDDGGADAGAAYLVAGADLASTPLSLSRATCALVGESAYDYAGWAVSAAGDVDGDGDPDLLVGALYNDEAAGNAGKAYLVMAADLSGYGSSEPLGNAHHEFLGEGLNDYAGCAVSSAGDVDGDGLADLLLGAEGDDGGGTNAGKAYLVVAADLSTSGGSTDLGTAFCSFQGEAARDYAGDALSSAGDVDADGYADLLIGAAENDAAGADAGKAYLVLGASLGSGGSLSLAGADIAIVGAAANDATGRSVADAGDVDGDGRDDILVGAPGNDTEGSNAGVTYLIFGVTLSAAGASLDMAAADYDYVYLGDDDDDYAGFATSGAGDVNGDGYADMLFGAYGVSSEFGRVYLWPSPGD